LITYLKIVSLIHLNMTKKLHAVKKVFRLLACVHCTVSNESNILTNNESVQISNAIF